MVALKREEDIIFITSDARPTASLFLFYILEFMLMPVRGVRGANVAKEDSPPAIFAATQELLHAILEANPALKTDDLASAFFTMTEDLQAIYPAQAARKMGWQDVPLLCSREIQTPDGLPRCIRVLLHWNTELSQNAVQHVYLGEAACLRPDLNGIT